MYSALYWTTRHYGPQIWHLLTPTWIHNWNEPYLPLLPAAERHHTFGLYLFPVPLRIGGWVSLQMSLYLLKLSVRCRQLMDFYLSSSVTLGVSSTCLTPSHLYLISHRYASHMHLSHLPCILLWLITTLWFKDTRLTASAWVSRLQKA